ncbi:hypothetical protein [Roseimarinus sediminis]|uniref:hypothetical protein n=1 Tax=Roseimarinus sediminis TaxID=1610899 RepID=UPI003D1C9A5E
MKKLINLLGLAMMAMSAFSQDVMVQICALQDTQAVSVDSIEVYNETNGSTLHLTNLAQTKTVYNVNLTKGIVSGQTRANSLFLSTQGKVNLRFSNGEYQIEMSVSYPQQIRVNAYAMSGRLLSNQRFNAQTGENVFTFSTIGNHPCILQVISTELHQNFKIGFSIAGLSEVVSINSNSENIPEKSATTFTYHSGDRVHFSVSKKNLQSRTWMGQPANGDVIRLAIPKNDRKFDMAQTLSNSAQVNTISYSGVAFYTGCFYASTFYPPGKVADYFGFQYFRDNDPDEGGHNTDFLTKAAYHMINLLDDSQLGVLIDLAIQQDSLISAYAYARMPVIKAFHRYLDSDIPAGKTLLNKEAVVNASREIYLIDGELSYGRAKAFSTVIKSLTQEQKDYLYALNVIGMQLWEMPEKPKDRGIPRDQNTNVMTNASEMFSWFLGSHEADTYFCPERQGTYFGGFFMKDAPAMGNAGYAIDMETTADKGKYMLANILDNTQAQKIKGIYTTVQGDLNNITATRDDIATELRKFWDQDEIDKQKILDLSAQYGAFDGNYIFTMADQFVEVARTLTQQQKDTLMWLRELDDFPCKPDTVFLYSKEIPEPEIVNTDSFFK